MKLAYVVGSPEIANLAAGWVGEPAEMFSRLAEIGYQGIELQVRDPALFDTARLADDARRAGLAIVGLSTGPVAMADGLFFTSPQSENRRCAVERAKAILDLAARYQAHLTIGGIRGFLRWAPARATGLGWFRQAIDELLPLAEAQGVPVMLEPQNRFATDFLNTVAETVEFITGYSSPSLVFEADTYHMSLEESSVPAALVHGQLSGTMRYLQVADSNRKAPGRGHLNWADILGTLQSTGYQGWLSVECAQIPDSTTCAREAHEFLSAALRARGG
jgi:5-keto-L-gluconate epimerase